MKNKVAKNLAQSSSTLKYKWNRDQSCVAINGPQLQSLAAEMAKQVVESFSSDMQKAKFVWQYWHEPDRYTHLRTPAESFFDSEMFDAWLHVISEISQQGFGCAELSPAWLSLYTDGCLQNWHADKPHGPWAFVYSLTRKPHNFHGGRTLILKNCVLDYWNNISDGQNDAHSDQIVEAFVPEFGQLLVFDSRIPHAVEQVRGVLGPAEGRIVVHGWFTQPRPFVEGPLNLENVLKNVDPVIEDWLSSFEPFPTWYGVCTLRVEISPTGQSQASFLASTLVDIELRQYVDFKKTRSFKKFVQSLSALKFPKQSAGSTLTLPLVFSPN